MNPNPTNHFRQVSYSEGRALLHNAGFTPQEIEMLCRLRAKHDNALYKSTIFQPSQPPKPPKNSQLAQTNPTTRTPQLSGEPSVVQHRNWVEHVLRILSKFCRQAADTEADFWLYTHFPY